jgi:TonB family protein
MIYLLTGRNIHLKLTAMKRMVVLILLATFSVAVFAQDPVALGELKVTPPRFAGIDNVVPFLKNMETQSMGDYVSENFHYPDQMDMNIDEGTVIVQFKILPTGKLADFQVINSVSPEVDAEVLRVLESTNGMWIPGTSDGKPVAMKREFALLVKLGGSKESAEAKDFVEIARSSFSKGCTLFLDRNKPQRALKHYDKGIRYRPNDKALLYMRGLCRYQAGNEEGARTDWHRLRDLGGADYESFYLAEAARELKGYEEMVQILKDQE